MARYGLYGGVPWLTNTGASPCFICKITTEDLTYFDPDCPEFEQPLTLGLIQTLKLLVSVAGLITDQEGQERLQLLLEELPLHFDNKIRSHIRHDR